MSQKSYVFLIILIGFCLSSCDQKLAEDAYFPFNENMSWHYDAKFKAGRIFNHHKLIIANRPLTTIDGKKVLARLFHNGDTAFYDQDENGIFRVAMQRHDGELIKDSQSHYVLRFPLVEGNQWQINSKAFFLERSVREINAGQASLSRDLSIVPLLMIYNIEAVDQSIKVAAGEFSHCVRIKGTGNTTGSGAEIGSVKIHVEQTDWYAPEVGLIKSIRKETSNIKWAKSSTFTMELDKLYSD